MKRPLTVGFLGANSESHLTYIYGNTIEAAHHVASMGHRLATFGDEGLNKAVRLGAIQGTQFMTPEEAFIDLSELEMSDIDGWIVLPGGYEVFKRTLEIVTMIEQGKNVPLFIASRAVNMGLSTFGHQAYQSGHTLNRHIDWVGVGVPIEAAHQLCESILRA